MGRLAVLLVMYSLSRRRPEWGIAWPSLRVIWGMALWVAGIGVSSLRVSCG
jgi:hypothetical protein